MSTIDVVSTTPQQRATLGELSSGARAILAELVIHGSSSRAELAKALGLSKSSLTRHTRELVQAELVAEGETQQRAATGRPSEMLHVIATTAPFIGLKLTGDRLYAVVSSLLGDILDQWDEALRCTDPNVVVEQIAEAVSRARAGYPALAGLGVTLAGAISDTGDGAVVLESEFLDWHLVALQNLVAKATGLPVAIRNDVQALCEAEHWFGVGDHVDSMVLVTVGAGVGCGIIANGRLVVGAKGRPGDVAHLAIDSRGPICRIGHRGCVDVYLTNNAISRSLSLATEQHVDYEGAVALHRAGNAAARRVFDEAGDALGRIIGTLLNLFDPAKVVLTGDGIAVWEFSQASVLGAIADTYVGDPGAVNLLVAPFEFDEWARAAAIAAVRSALEATDRQ